MKQRHSIQRVLTPRPRRLALTACIAAVAFALSARTCPADRITFEGLSRGEVLTDQYAASHGVRFSAVNNHSGHPDKLAIFDSEDVTGGDPDLGYPWAGGNLAGEPLGNLFIIAEDDVDGDGDGLIDDPDDESRGGVAIIEFDALITSFRFDSIDVDDGAGYSVDIYRDGGLLDTLTYDALEQIDPTIDFGDHKANRMPWITAETVGGAFDEVRINVAGSHGFDSIEFNRPEVPEPAALATLTIGGAAALLRRRGRTA